MAIKAQHVRYNDLSEFPWVVETGALGSGRTFSEKVYVQGPDLSWIEFALAQPGQNVYDRNLVKDVAAVFQRGSTSEGIEVTVPCLPSHMLPFPCPIFTFAI